jgi:hypothetical protein
MKSMMRRQTYHLFVGGRAMKPPVRRRASQLKLDKLPSGSQWLHEIKHDGFRTITRKNGAQLRLYSRPGNELTHRFPLIVDAPCIIDGEAVACDYNGVASFDLVRHRRAQNFPLNLPTNRRLCSTVGGRIVEGWTAHCCAVSAARSRAATMTNLARSSLALALPALFGAAKSCALVNLFMICPRGRLVASRQRPGLAVRRFCVPHGPGITLSHSRSTLG